MSLRALATGAALALGGVALARLATLRDRVEREAAMKARAHRHGHERGREHAAASFIHPAARSGTESPGFGGGPPSPPAAGAAAVQTQQQIRDVTVSVGASEEVERHLKEEVRRR